MKHGLIFDLDGTLVDSLLGIAASLNRALAMSGLPTHPADAVRGFIGNGAQVLVQRAAPPGENESSLTAIGQAFKVDYDLTWPEGTFAYDGNVQLLELLQVQGYPLAVLSNKPHLFTEAIVAQVFPTIRFSVVLGQRAGIPHKPDPTGALEICHGLQLDPARCIVIGDSTMDLETAGNAGMKAVAVTWGYHDRGRLITAGAGLIADHPANLLDILLRVTAEDEESSN
jgi:phosphoglycolate phosphatase